MQVEYTNDKNSFGNRGLEGISIVQRENLRFLEGALRQQWNLGQNILLCWCIDDIGVQALVVPHYFLSNFSSSLNNTAPKDKLDALNGRFMREMIAGKRLMELDEFESTARRLEIIPTEIHLPIPLQREPVLIDSIEAMVKRYSITFVKNRAVLLYDIVNFSLAMPFEQASQLSSLSYSLNAAYNKLLKKNIKINFNRTTTGDGYYVWHSDTSPRANMELFQFMLLVVADNAIAHRKAKANTVPLIRTGFHIGSHYEFYQVEGLNPSMSSYIVGDVTIELARMIDLAMPGQVFIGDYQVPVPTSAREGAYLIDADSQHFVERAGKHMEALRGLELSGEKIESIHGYLTGETGASAGQSVRRFRITDKHGRSRNVYNMRINIQTGKGRPILLGVQDSHLPKRSFQGTDRTALSAVASALSKRSKTSISAAED